MATKHNSGAVHEGGGTAQATCPLCQTRQTVQFHAENVQLGYRPHYCTNPRCGVCFRLDLTTGATTVT